MFYTEFFYLTLTTKSIIDARCWRRPDEWGKARKKKKRARVGNSSRRYKSCWVFVTVNKTNRRLEFAYELPRSGISRTTAMVFSFELTPSLLRLASLRHAHLTRGRCFSFETMAEERGIVVCTKVSDFRKNLKTYLGKKKARAELTRRIFNSLCGNLRSYRATGGETSSFYSQNKLIYTMYKTLLTFLILS